MASAAPAPAKPDLTITSFTVNPSQPAGGQPFTPSCTVTNSGTSSAGAFDLVVNVGSEQKKRVSSLGPGRSLTYAPTFSPLGQGERTLECVADPATWTRWSGEVSEAREDNNRKSFRATWSAPPKPDLIISALSAVPSSVVAQQTFSVHCTVKNIGPVNTGKGFQVTLHRPGWSLPVSQSSPALAAGATTTLVFSSERQDAGPARYTCVADTAITSRVEEAREDNNERAEAFTIAAPAKPDLLITSVIWDPSEPLSQQTFSVTCRVTNRGNAGTTGTFPVELDRPGWFSGSTRKQAGPLAAGASADVVFTGERRDAGAANYNCVADPTLFGSGAIIEQDEGNNLRPASIAVRDPPKPDLSIASITFDKDPAHLGTVITATCTIQNTASVPTGPVQVRLRFAGKETTTQVTPGINTASPGKVTAIHTRTTTGTDEAECTADSDHKISESNENNNGWTEKATWTNAAPQITNLAPADNAQDQPTTVRLTWGTTDPDDSNLIQHLTVEKVLFRLGFDIRPHDDVLDQHEKLVTGSTYDLTGLTPDALYCWRTKAEDPWGAKTTGPVSCFRTAGTRAAAEVRAVSLDREEYRPGDTVHITARLCNTGDVGLSGLRLNADVYHGGRPLKEGVFQEGLARNRGSCDQDIAKAYWTVPADAAAGVYEAIVGVHDGNPPVTFHRAEASFRVVVPSQRLTSVTWTDAAGATIGSAVHGDSLGLRIRGDGIAGQLVSIAFAEADPLGHDRVESTLLRGFNIKAPSDDFRYSFAEPILWMVDAEGISPFLDPEYIVQATLGGSSVEAKLPVGRWAGAEPTPLDGTTVRTLDPGGRSEYLAWLRDSTPRALANLAAMGLKAPTQATTLVVMSKAEIERVTGAPGMHLPGLFRNHAYVPYNDFATLQHELMHAVQTGYPAKDAWWDEGTARLSERFDANGAWPDCAKFQRAVDFRDWEGTWDQYESAASFVCSVIRAFAPSADGAAVRKVFLDAMAQPGPSAETALSKVTGVAFKNLTDDWKNNTLSLTPPAPRAPNNDMIVTGVRLLDSQGRAWYEPPSQTPLTAEVRLFNLAWAFPYRIEARLEGPGQKVIARAEHIVGLAEAKAGAAQAKFWNVHLGLLEHGPFVLRVAVEDGQGRSLAAATVDFRLAGGRSGVSALLSFPDGPATAVVPPLAGDIVARYRDPQEDAIVVLPGSAAGLQLQGEPFGFVEFLGPRAAIPTLFLDRHLRLVEDEAKVAGLVALKHVSFDAQPVTIHPGRHLRPALSEFANPAALALKYGALAEQHRAGAQQAADLGSASLFWKTFQDVVNQAAAARVGDVPDPVDVAFFGADAAEVLHLYLQLHDPGLSAAQIDNRLAAALSNYKDAAQMVKDARDMAVNYLEAAAAWKEFKKTGDLAKQRDALRAARGLTVQILTVLEDRVQGDLLWNVEMLLEWVLSLTMLANNADAQAELLDRVARGQATPDDARRLVALALSEGAIRQALWQRLEAKYAERPVALAYWVEELVNGPGFPPDRAMRLRGGAGFKVDLLDLAMAQVAEDTAESLRLLRRASPPDAALPEPPQPPLPRVVLTATPEPGPRIVHAGQPLGFAVELRVEHDLPRQVQWYVDGTLEDTDVVSVHDLRSAFSHTFPAEGGFRVRAVARSAEGAEAEAVWQVRAETPPPPSPATDRPSPSRPGRGGEPTDIPRFTDRNGWFAGFIPAEPRAGEPLRFDLAVPAGNGCTGLTLASRGRDGNTFHVAATTRIHGEVCSAVMSWPRASLLLGSLEAGAYYLMVSLDGAEPVLAGFDVSPGALAPATLPAAEPVPPPPPGPLQCGDPALGLPAASPWDLRPGAGGPRLPPGDGVPIALPPGVMHYMEWLTVADDDSQAWSAAMTLDAWRTWSRVDVPSATRTLTIERALAPGTHVFELLVCDPAGNAARWSRTVTVQGVVEGSGGGPALAQPPPSAPTLTPPAPAPPAPASPEPPPPRAPSAPPLTAEPPAAAVAPPACAALPPAAASPWDLRSGSIAPRLVPPSGAPVTLPPGVPRYEEWVTVADDDSQAWSAAFTNDGWRTWVPVEVGGRMRIVHIDHAFTAPGFFTLDLLVCDPAGNTARWSRAVTVAPRAEPEVPQAVPTVEPAAGPALEAPPGAGPAPGHTPDGPPSPQPEAPAQGPGGPAEPPVPLAPPVPAGVSVVVEPVSTAHSSWGVEVVARITPPERIWMVLFEPGDGPRYYVHHAAGVVRERHQYAPGVHQVVVTVRDTEGATHVGTAEVVVAAPEVPPGPAATPAPPPATPAPPAPAPGALAQLPVPPLAAPPAPAPSTGAPRFGACGGWTATVGQVVPHSCNVEDPDHAGGLLLVEADYGRGFVNLALDRWGTFATHQGAFDTPGQHRVRIRVSDPAGLTAEREVVVTVRDTEGATHVGTAEVVVAAPEVPPGPAATPAPPPATPAPAPAAAPQAPRFGACGGWTATVGQVVPHSCNVEDPDHAGGLLLVEADYGRGFVNLALDRWGTFATHQGAFDTPGQHRVRIRVSDPAGLTAEREVVVTVT